MVKRSPHEILTALEQSGELNILVKGGILSTCVMRNLELYRYIDARVKTGSSKMQAIRDAGANFNLCHDSIFKIIRGFQC